jgi:L-ascorbate metabolism protein UlaG (beta-lactamase superfamily)
MQRPVAAAPVKPQPDSWDPNKITLAWLGQATVLINFYGLNILTDPVFSTRIGLDLGVGTLGPKRFIAPALKIKDLPPIDVVLLSHAHLDHMDLPSLNRLLVPPFAVTANGTRDVIAGTPVKNAVELRWGEHTTCRGPKGELRVEAIQVKHWGARWRKDTWRGYNGYLLTRGGKTLIFGGDTAYTPLFAELRPRGPFELAILPIAAYDPWIRNHCTPEQAVQMTNEAGVRHLVPVHHSTFKLSNEPMTEPMERLQAALQHEPERIAVNRVGETFTVS